MFSKIKQTIMRTNSRYFQTVEDFRMPKKSSITILFTRVLLSEH